MAGTKRLIQRTTTETNVNKRTTNLFKTIPNAVIFPDSSKIYKAPAKALTEAKRLLPKQ